MKNLFLLLIALSTSVYAQHNNPNPGYWQQHVDYKMDVHMNVENYTYTGTQALTYTNNSPDTLQRVFYHLYFNARSEERRVGKEWRSSMLLYQNTHNTAESHA